MLFWAYTNTVFRAVYAERFFLCLLVYTAGSRKGHASNFSSELIHIILLKN
jgi:hypothetical protein